MADNKKLPVPYVPWKTFISVLESFTKFLPGHVHKSMWPSYSGATQSQVMLALRFLNLIEEDHAPSELLRRIAEADKAQWPTLMQEVLKKSYVALMQCDLTKATPGSFDAEIRKFGQEGDTHRKAASFFLQAAKYANVPLSPLLAQKGGLSSSRKKRSSPAKKSAMPAKPPSGEGENDPVEQSRMEASGVKKIIHMDNESFLSLTLNKNFGELPSLQRRFVNKLIDLMEEFVDNNYEELPKGIA